MSDVDLAAYERLIQLLDEHRADYELIDHAPEGRTQFVSPLRGNELAAAAKCMVVMVRVGRKGRRYVLAVVPGDRQVDFDALKALCGGRYAGLADVETAEALSGCVVGTVVPFSWNEELELVVDPDLYMQNRIFFNAARLDRSLSLDSADHRKIAAPLEAPISRPA